MGDGLSTRRVRHARPGVERLEGRALLSAGRPGISAMATTSIGPPFNTPGALQQVDYTTPDGARVDIRLFGVGTLAGTTVDPDGALNLVFSGTNAATGIVATVHGGSRHAALRSIRSANAPAGTLSGIGGTLIDVINLKDFDLVSGGQVNLTSGVHVLFLNSVAQNSQILLREMPAAYMPAATPSPNLAVPNAATAANSIITPTTTTGTGTTGTTGTTGGTGTTGTTGTTTTTTTTTTTGTTTVITGATVGGTFTESGTSLTYSGDSSGALTLTNVSGLVAPGPNQHVNNITTANPNSPPPGPPPAPAGVVLSINHVRGPARNGATLGNPNLFAYDQTTGALVRFDAATGNPTLTIPNALHGTTAVEAGVALARSNGQLLVLVSDGTAVFAYDANTGAPAGSFLTDTLHGAGVGLTNPTRLGTFDTYTVIGDPTAGPTGLGRLVPINVSQSLATGHAQRLTDASGTPVAAFSSQRAFQLTGGLAGIPGQNTLYAAGAGHFDPFQPDQFQLGVAALNPSIPTTTSPGGTLRETTRTVLTGNAASGSNGTGTIVTNAQGATVASPGSNLPVGNPNNALGSIDQSLALDNGLVVDSTTGQTVNMVSLYSPTALARQAALALNTPDVLTDLSGSFRPALAGAALVDVQGDTQSFRTNDARGLVFNGEGNVNLVKIHQAADSTIIGYPLGHAQIPLRTDTALITSTRSVQSRNGVTQVSTIKPTGPLMLP